VSGSELIYLVADASGDPSAESFTAYRVPLR
jgi:hypothetical protein